MPDLPTDLPLDFSLAAVTLWVAWRALAHEDLFVSVVLFISFGLLMSLLWVRLGAVDIALAEATIGAGITGALLLDALRAAHRAERRMGAGDGDLTAAPAAHRGLRRRAAPAAGALLAAALAIALALAVAALPDAPGGLGARIVGEPGRAGVSNPVTAVLIDFRGYDTLLETFVLLLAAIGMLAVRRIRDVSHGASGGIDPPLEWLARLLLPVMVLTVGHLLLLGTRGAGGGFQAGALLGAAAILLLLAGGRSVAALPGVWLRAALVLGPAAFLSAALATLAGGGRFLEIGGPGASSLVLTIEAAIAIATALTLAALFVGARPDGLPMTGPLPTDGGAYPADGSPPPGGADRPFQNPSENPSGRASGGREA